MAIPFTKMHGAGNDFVLLDGISQRLQLRPRDIRRIADRRRGVGCDQVLVAEAPARPDVDFRYRIFNADGGEARQCGNGARCFARFVRRRKLTGLTVMRVETCGDLLTLELRDNQQVDVTMGCPRFAPGEIPLRRAQSAPQYDLHIAGETLRIGALSVGNPHAVLRVEAIDDDLVERLGPAIEAHEDFPQGVNAGFLRLVDRSHVKLRVYERGVGETPACGSGACAAVVHGRRMGWLDERVSVELPGGRLVVSWAGEGQPIHLSGPTAISFEGALEL